MKVHEYVSPAVFEKWRQQALDLGFLYCASGPLVRSSYKAGEAFIENVLKKRLRKSEMVVGMDDMKRNGVSVITEAKPDL